MNKRELSERNFVTKFILPGIQKLGWNVAMQVHEDISFTDGRIFVKCKVKMLDLSFLLPSSIAEQKEIVARVEYTYKSSPEPELKSPLAKHPPNSLCKAF